MSLVKDMCLGNIRLRKIIRICFSFNICINLNYDEDGGIIVRADAELEDGSYNEHKA